MAFTDMSLHGALWQHLGLHYLLMPEDVFFKRDTETYAFTQDSLRARAHAPVQRSAEAARKAFQPQAWKADAQKRPQKKTPSVPGGPVRGSWQSVPPETLPSIWQERMQKSRPGLVAWTYWKLGADLCTPQQVEDSQRQARRAYLQRILKDLRHPGGTHTFWPCCLPEASDDEAPDAPPIYRPNAAAFWSGLTCLDTRGVVVMGSAAVQALELPAGLRPLQQTRYRGHLVWILQDVEYLLEQPHGYAPMLAFLQQALRPLIRR